MLSSRAQCEFRGQQRRRVHLQAHKRKRSWRGKAQVRDPGIELMFNDYRMENYTSNVSGTGASLVLDYCREEGSSFAPKMAQSGFFESGDVSLDRRDSHAGLYEFPLKRYSGISIGIDLKSISCDFPEVARSLPVTPPDCRKSSPTPEREPSSRGTPRSNGYWTDSTTPREHKPSVLPHQGAGSPRLSGDG